MAKPNIFFCMTREASQQSFLSWLMSWANPAGLAINAELHNLAHKLLEAFFNKHKRKPPGRIEKVEICGGYNNIDILLVINDSIVIPIADKVYKRESPDRLLQYIQVLKDDGYSEKDILPIYLQTGAQGNEKKLQAIGFPPFTMKVLSDVLKSGKDINNDILNDYIENLEWLDSMTQNFMHCDLNEWHFLYSWEGFYNYLQSELLDGEWDVLSNSSNSFLGFWWHRQEDKDCVQYLQLERVYGNPELCFKIKVNNKKRRVSLKWKWCHKFLKASEGSPVKVIKPVYHNNNDITVAVVDGDYRRADKDGKIDLNKTMEVIIEAQKIFDKAVKCSDLKFNKWCQIRYHVGY